MYGYQENHLPPNSDGECEVDDSEEEWQKWRVRPVSLTGAQLPPLKRQKLDSFLSTSLNETSNDPSTDKLGTGEHNRVIVHIDIDCFYAQVEMIRNPCLRDRPVGVSQKHILVTCNYVARAMGLKKLISLAEAKKKCPDLVIINGEDLTKYREFSSRVTKLLRRFAVRVERLGLDENYVDVSELVQERMKHAPRGSYIAVGCIYGDSILKGSSNEVCPCGCHERLTVGSVIASELRKAIFDEIGLTTCAGIAHNKLLAKIAGEQNKPNKQTLLYTERVEGLMGLLPVRKVPGIGRSTCARLDSLGITTIAELQECSKKALLNEFNSQEVRILHALSHGADDSQVSTDSMPKSISEEDSYSNLCSLESVKTNLRVLIGNLIPRITEDTGHPQTVRLAIRRGGQAPGVYKKESRQCPVPDRFAMNTPNSSEKINVLFGTVFGLFHKLVDVSKSFQVRVLNVCLTNFQRRPERKTITNFFQGEKGNALGQNYFTSLVDASKPDSDNKPKSCDIHLTSETNHSESSSGLHLLPPTATNSNISHNSKKPEFSNKSSVDAFRSSELSGKTTKSIGTTDIISHSKFVNNSKKSSVFEDSASSSIVSERSSRTGQAGSASFCDSQYLSRSNVKSDASDRHSVLSKTTTVLASDFVSHQNLSSRKPVLECGFVIPKGVKDHNLSYTKKNSVLEINALIHQGTRDENSSSKKTSAFGKDSMIPEGARNQDSSSSNQSSILRCDLVIPEGVDSSVFECLPHDIQMEFYEQWKRDAQYQASRTDKKPQGLRKTDKKPQGLRKTDKKPKGLLRYFLKS